MIEQTLYIRNMVCDRCITTVGENLRKFNIAFKSIQLGEVVLLGPLEQNQMHHFSWQLGIYGFELLDHPNACLIKMVKEIIIERIDNNALAQEEDLIQFISDKLHLDIEYLNMQFASVECMSVEKFIDLQRVEQVKKYLCSHRLTLKKIADYLGYRNTKDLSNQFRVVTGMTPVQFKTINQQSMNSVG